MSLRSIRRNALFPASSQVLTVGGWGQIANNHVAAAAAIAYSKLNLAASIVNADIAGAAAIAYSKLNLAASIVNADIAAAAAIAVTKLALGGANTVLGSNGATNSFGQVVTAMLATNAITEVTLSSAGSAFSTPNSSPTAVTGSTQTINPGAGVGYYLLYMCTGTLSNNTTNGVTVVQAMVDGASAGQFSTAQSYLATAAMPFSICMMLGPYTGSHTFGLGINVGAGTTGTVNVHYQSLVVIKK